jgi:pimeloyl-ACP methyl ester carboxylesterase
MEEVRLSQGTIRYRDSDSGEPIVFAHGLLVNGLLWRKVVPLLQPDFRCIVPDLPLGSHRLPMEPEADLSPPGLGRIVDEFIGALGLDRVTLVANDTGGAIAQITAANHPERIERLVLTNCDAFENFLPPAFRPLQWAARVPGLLTVALQGMRLDLLRRRSPMAFGWLIKHDVRGAPLEEWMRPFLSSREIRRDTVKVLRGIDPGYTQEAAVRLSSSGRPTLIAWAEEDRFFKFSFAKQLAETLPGARLERIPNSYTFVAEDQPERLAELIGGFVREPAPARA